MKNITIQTKVADIVSDVPARARVFEDLGIDYCCGGKTPLGEVCESMGLDPESVITMLNAIGGQPQAPSSELETMTLVELCDHIEQSHHNFLIEELPRLDFLTHKVAEVHGNADSRLMEIRQLFERFNAEMVRHTQEENEQVFPAIRALETGKGNQNAATTTLKEEFSKLETEHQRAGDALANFRSLSENYTPPEWACTTFRALYDGLHQLEKDMHQHVHKENNVLFPRALALGA